MNSTLPRQPVQDALVVIEPEASLQLCADRITQSYERSVGAHVATGQLLIQAKATKKHGDFGRLFKDHPRPVNRPVPFSQNMAEHLMRIARHPVLSNSAHWADLPSSWRTLYELSKLEPSIVESCIASGKIHPEMTRIEVEKLVVERRDPGRSTAAIQSIAEELYWLQETESAIRAWAREVNEELARGVSWIQGVPGSTTQSRPIVTRPKRCTCATCGHSHLDRLVGQRAPLIVDEASLPRIEGQLNLVNQGEVPERRGVTIMAAKMPDNLPDITKAKLPKRRKGRAKRVLIMESREECPLPNPEQVLREWFRLMGTVTGMVHEVGILNIVRALRQESYSRRQKHFKTFRRELGQILQQVKLEKE